MRRSIATIATAALTLSCASKSAEEPPRPDARAHANTMQKLDVDVTTSEEFGQKYQSFDSYWFRGKAELNRFVLEQSRYGEIHEGDAVMVFVTEPFDMGDHVKYEGVGDESDVEQVLKLNNYRHFYTGVYPYTILTSTFSPVSGGMTPKLTHSVTEWCGHVFTQLNAKDDGTGYAGDSYSYFQREGDRKLDLSTKILEDELYTQIRLGPEKLPIGEVELVPSLNFLRFMHKPYEAYTANATLSDPAHSDYSDAPVRTYTLTYPTFNRSLKIFFEADFPYRIVGFEDTRKALFNPNGGQAEELTTRGKLDRSIMLDYWSKHGNEDRVWREALGLGRPRK